MKNLFIVALLAICFNCVAQTHKVVKKSAPAKISHSIGDTVVIPVMLNTSDSLVFYKKHYDSLRHLWSITNFKITREKNYINIVDKNHSQAVFLKPWSIRDGIFSISK